MRLPASILGAAVLLAASSAFAQTPKEERRDKMKAAHEQARKACEGKTGAEQRDCMVKQMCAQAKDPAACETRAAKAKDSHREARKACEGKQGAEHQECIVKQMCAQAKDPAKCETQGKERMARREKIREACKDKRGEELKACIREHREPRSKS